MTADRHVMLHVFVGYMGQLCVNSPCLKRETKTLPFSPILATIANVSRF